MKRKTFGILAALCVTLIAGVALAVHLGDSVYFGRILIQGSGTTPTCATASSAVGSLCVDQDLEANDDLDVGDDATVRDDLAVLGDLSVSATATVGTTLSVTGASTLGGNVTLSRIVPYNTSINFLEEGWQPIFAKSTRAVITNIDTQEDFFYVGSPQRYFDLFQDGDVASIVTAFSPSTAGWVMPGDDETDTGWQLTQGILLGPAYSFTVGTDAFYMQVAFYLPEIDQHAELFVGFRVLGAYAVADDATELKTAYNRKVLLGLEEATAKLVQYTSVAAGTDVGPTTCTGTDPVDGDVVVLKVAVSAAGATTVSYGKAAAAGGSAAEVAAALATAEAALTPDALCNAASVTLDAATEVVPTIMLASANGTGANTSTIVKYFVGMQ